MVKKNDNLSQAVVSDDKPAVRPPAAKRRRRRRFVLKLTVTLVAFLLLLALLSPWLLSTRAGTSLVLSIVNKGLRGQIQVDDLSLSWSGPIQVKGFRLLDARRRNVLSAQRAEVQFGIWRALRSPEHFTDVTIESPQLVLYELPKGGFSLFEIFPSKKEKEEKPLPSPEGKISLRNGSVRLVRNDGRELQARDIELSFEVNSLNDLTGKLQLALAEGGKLDVEMGLRGLAQKDTLDLAGASGTLTIRTPEEVNLAQLRPLTNGKTSLSGNMDIRAEARFQPRSISLRFGTGLKEFAAHDVEQSNVRPITLASEGKVDFALSPGELRGVSGNVAVKGEGVQFATDVSYRNPEAESWPSVDDLLDAVLDGKAITVPDISLRANGEADLERLAQAVPALLNVRENVRLSSGRVLVENIAVDGGATPKAEGTLRVTDLSAIRTQESTAEEKTVQWKPILIQFDASLVEKEGLQVKAVKLESEIASLHGAGSPKKMEAQLDADLAALSRQLSPVLPELADLNGRLNLTATVERAGDSFAFVSAGTLSAPSVNAETIDLSAEQFAFDARGLFHRKEKKIGGDLKLTAKELLTTLSGRNHADDKYRVASLRLETAAAWTPAGELTFSTGSATFAKPSLNAQPLVESDLALNWSGMTYSPEGKSLAASEFSLEGKDLLKLSVAEARAWLAEQARVEGRFSLSADIAKSVATAKPFAGWKEPPDIAGTLAWSGRAVTAGNTITAAGSATIDGFQLGSGEKPFRPGRVELTHEASVNFKEDLLSLSKLSLASQPLSLDLAGKVEKLGSERVLDLSGHYKGSWEHLLALLEQLSPSVKSELGLALAGTTESDLRITGPLNRPEVQPAFRGVTTDNIRLDWTSGQLVGLELGSPVNLQPRFSEGQLVLDGTKIPASGGSLNLSGIVNFAGEAPAFQMPGKTTLIDKVRVTPEVGRMLLSRINPIFAQVASLEGELTLSLSDLNLPLGDTILSEGAGSGHLDLSNLSLKPDGMLAALFELGGLLGKTSTSVTFTGADFTIKDGKVAYDNFAILFGEKFDLKFYGSVAFDDAVEMWVSVPVGPALLSAFGVKGPLETYAQRLATDNARLEIPIRGTRLSPALGTVNIGSLLEKISKSLLQQGLQDAGDLFKLPGNLMKNPLEIPKAPVEAPKKPVEGIRTPFEILKKPSDLMKKPGEAVDKTSATPDRILIDSLLELLKKQQDDSSTKNPTRK
jgi:hypothetical protein